MRHKMASNIKGSWRATRINDNGEILIYFEQTPIAIIDDFHMNSELKIASAQQMSAEPDLLAAIEGITIDLLSDMAVDEFMGEIGFYADVIKNPQALSVSREKFIKAEEAIAKAKAKVTN